MTPLEAFTFVGSSPLMPQCCNQTAHLASISDSAENERFRVITGPLSVGMIGLSNVDNPPTYAWEGTTEAVNYTNWCGCGDLQEPLMTNNSCAGMRGNDGRWFEGLCTDMVFVFLLVEYDCEPPPT
jgi:hypothetical protein